MCNFSSDPLDMGTLKLPESTVGMSLRKGCSSHPFLLEKGIGIPSIPQSYGGVVGFLFGFEKFDKIAVPPFLFRNFQSSVLASSL